MVTPITIKDVGDRKLRLADHAVLMAGVNADGEPVPMAAPGTNASGQTTVVEAANRNPETATLLEGGNIVASPGTPVSITGENGSVLAQSVELMALLTNAGNVKVGFSSVTPGIRVLTPGGTYSITAPPGKAIDLGQIYIDGDAISNGVSYTAIN